VTIRSAGQRPRSLAVADSGTIWVVGGDEEIRSVSLDLPPRTDPPSARDCKRPPRRGDPPAMRNQGWPAYYTGPFVGPDGRQTCDAAAGEVTCRSPSGAQVRLRAGHRPSATVTAAQALSQEAPQALSQEAPKPMPPGANFITTAGSVFCAARRSTIICRDLTPSAWYFVIGDAGACIGRGRTRIAPIADGLRSETCGAPAQTTPGWVSEQDGAYVRSRPRAMDGPLIKDRRVDIACVELHQGDAGTERWLRLAGPSEFADRYVAGWLVESYGEPSPC
jgi:hypothetical protein